MLSLLAQVIDVDTPEIEWLALTPHLVMAGAAVVLLTVVSVAGPRLPACFASAWTVAAGVAVIATAVPVWLRVSDEGPSSAVAGAIGVDKYSVFLIVLLAGTVVLTSLVADGFLRREGLDGPAFYVLLMLSAAGGMTMASANNLIVLFLGLEILSLAVYVLVAHAPAPRRVAGGGNQILRAGGVRIGVSALRHCVGVRSHRIDQSG